MYAFKINLTLKLSLTFKVEKILKQVQNDTEKDTQKIIVFYRVQNGLFSKLFQNVLMH